VCASDSTVVILIVTDPGLIVHPDKKQTTVGDLHGDGPGFMSLVALCSAVIEMYMCQRFAMLSGYLKLLP
jgi:hypothetical protein